MNSNRFSLGVVLVVGLLLFGVVGARASDDLIRKYESNGGEFKRAEIGNKIVYFQQRMIDDAIVEKDFILYHFDRGTKQLSGKKANWRSGLPESVIPRITREQAESMVEGKILFTKLYIISPDSDVFPVDPTPENPCWVVRSALDDFIIITVIDAITGEQLGYGTPPPQFTGFSFSGPQYSTPCSGTWKSWYLNASEWFETMGYPTEAVEYPAKEKVQSHIQNTKTAMFYEVAHGDSSGFSSDCSPTGYITASEIRSWISDYRKMPFTFFGSCNGMCDTGTGTLSYEFRKGSLSDTATMGYCGMSQDYCSDCWTYSVDWQDVLFSYMNEGYSVGESYDKAMADYPMCAPIEGSCMRFAGDEDFAIVPVVTRDVDSDNDGVPDQEEQGPEGSDPAFDGNDDSISDFLQDNAVSFLTRDKQNYLTIACPITASMSNVAAVDIPSPADAPSGVKFTYGFFDFRVHVYPGSSTTVILYLPEGASPQTYYKYGPTPDDPTDHWYEFLYDGETGAKIDGNVVTLYFVDGKRGDDDLNGTNGTIIDQGGMGFTTTDASSSGGGGGCFIATAAYRSFLEPYVKVLREFCNRSLITHVLEEGFQDLCSHCLPPKTDAITKDEREMTFMSSTVSCFSCQNIRTL